jgi:DNA-binding response OmpR family regulator
MGRQREGEIVRHLLVVDHDYATRFMMASGLRTLRCEVTDAETGTEAAWLLEHRKFDLAIIDALVPGVPAKRVLEQSLACKTLVLLTSDDEDVLSRCGEVGLCCLAKPFTLAQLLREVRRLLGDREGHLALCRRGMSRWGASLTGLNASLARSEKAVTRTRAECERGLQCHDVMALRTLAESYRGLAQACAGSAREDRLKLAARLERQASRREWMLDIEGARSNRKS